MRNRLVTFSILISFSIQAQQWTHMSYEFNSQFRDRVHFRSKLLNDSVLFLGVEGYTRGTGVDFTDLVVINASDGSIIRQKPLSLISGSTNISDIGFFESIGYLLEYWDDPNNTGAATRRNFLFCSYKDDQVLWSGNGELAPVGQGSGITFDAKVFSDSSAWFENDITGKLYRLDLNNGDTLTTVSSNLIADQLGLDTTIAALLGKLDSKYIKLRSDTVMTLLTDYVIDSNGIYRPRVFAAVIDGRSYSGINGYKMPLPSISNFRRNMPFDEYHYLIDSSEVLWGSGFVKRVFGKKSAINGSITDSVLMVDSLFYNPDTASFRENAPYEIYHNGDYIAYLESLTWPYVGDTSIVVDQNRLRLYKNGNLQYEEVILDTIVRAGGINTNITHLHILDDGSIIAIMKVGDNRPYTVSRVMRINPNGRHALSSNPEIQTSAREISIYPNPTHGSLHLLLPTDYLDSLVKVKVIDVSGKVVYSQELNPKEPIDLSQLETGVYTVCVLAKEARHSEKLIILK